MRIDLEDAAHGTKFQSDVCIVGGGVAGLILARKLGELGKTVHLLEAGGPTGRNAQPGSLQCRDSRRAPSRHDGRTTPRLRRLVDALGGADASLPGRGLSAARGGPAESAGPFQAPTSRPTTRKFTRSWARTTCRSTIRFPKPRMASHAQAPMRSAFASRNGPRSRGATLPRRRARSASLRNASPSFSTRTRSPLA